MSLRCAIEHLSFIGSSYSPVTAGYFSFDLPSITADDLKRLLAIDNEQYGLLFSGEFLSQWE
jgi:hypothetical protein